MLPELYTNKPRDFIVDSGHCAISALKSQRIDYRAIVPNAPEDDDVTEGIQIVRVMNEAENGGKIPSGKYFVITAKDVRTQSFASLLTDVDFFIHTTEGSASTWRETMQRCYARKKDRHGKLAFPLGLTDDTQFVIYHFTPIVVSSAQEFLLAQFLFYQGVLPPQIESDWLTHYGANARANVERRAKGLL
jgi:hypothetical protein